MKEVQKREGMLTLLVQQKSILCLHTKLEFSIWTIVVDILALVDSADCD